MSLYSKYTTLIWLSTFRRLADFNSTELPSALLNPHICITLTLVCESSK